MSNEIEVIIVFTSINVILHFNINYVRYVSDKTAQDILSMCSAYLTSEDFRGHCKGVVDRWTCDT